MNIFLLCQKWEMFKISLKYLTYKKKHQKELSTANELGQKTRESMIM